MKLTIFDEYEEPKYKENETLDKVVSYAIFGVVSLGLVVSGLGVLSWLGENPQPLE
jgi:hypothetical protein|tara:strand:- start:106 stop:273 length:168 start_codon:yes stop_codon:yes gene_type:complete